MPINHYVPSGKVLVVPTGNYRFVGPAHVFLSGQAVNLPKTYEDGSPVVSTPTAVKATPKAISDAPVPTNWKDDTAELPGPKS